VKETLMKNRSDLTKATRILKAPSGLALLAAFLLGSCYATTALSTRNTGGPVKVFELGQRIPRNSKILDIVDSTGGWAEAGEMSSCRYRPIIKYLKKRTMALGGDAVAVLHVKKPLLWHSCFTIKAFLLDTIDISDWPRVGLTEEEIRRDLVARRQVLDDIEGIWDCRARSAVKMDVDTQIDASVYESSQNMGDPWFTGVSWVPPSVIQAMGQLSPEEQGSYRVAIVKAVDDTNYPYAAYILDPKIQEWQAGFLKARLRKIPDSSGYWVKWYGSTFQDDLREFHPDEKGALKAKVVVKLGLKYSIEQTLTKVYPPVTAGFAPD
jgi:hypothetical protein